MAEQSSQPSGLPTAIDRFSTIVGHATAWLTLVMVLVTIAIVVLRYLFDTGVIWLQESLTWMHAVVFMLGAAYTLRVDEHVRVDIFYREMSTSRQAWVNLLGVVIFLWPLCGFLGVMSFDYVAAAWRIGEVSLNSGGLPYPALPLLKSMLLLMPLTVSLQGLSMVLHSWQQIRRGT